MKHVADFGQLVQPEPQSAPVALTDEQITTIYETEMNQSLRPQDKPTVLRVCKAVLAKAPPNHTALLREALEYLDDDRLQWNELDRQKRGESKQAYVDRISQWTQKNDDLSNLVDSITKALGES